FDLLPFDKEHGFAVVEHMRAIARRHNASVAQVALAWLLAKDAVSSILIGASKLPQLEDNLGAASIKLSAEEVAELDAATPLAPVYPNWFIDNLADPTAVEATAR
ncbi:aldo/keto reductase, partial [Collimonas sp.]|uniref:aldo/keto reductase n=1 Tax=Collimonas sp. TaxID=1963772 RepID=UPI002CD38DB8